ncbi:hypothetical protein OIU74_008182 [Salix koriyanagi]|uniref:Uncharacterized protein n=1 Tax=Salix koriyanagi TaxID=2511006 RepID=A0A9Q0Z733_9ROSI|nr:hypothetical protein OIU74_008182 [Salix koriyanagi]
MGKLTKCARKLKKVLKRLQRDSNSMVVNYSVSSPKTVTCEELFLSSAVQKGHRRNDNYDRDPFLAAISPEYHHSEAKYLYLRGRHTDYLLVADMYSRCNLFLLLGR